MRLDLREHVVNGHLPGTILVHPPAVTAKSTIVNADIGRFEMKVAIETDPFRIQPHLDKSGQPGKKAQTGSFEQIDPLFPAYPPTSPNSLLYVFEYRIVAPWICQNSDMFE
jgi:hypothetical protein